MTCLHSNRGQRRMRVGSICQVLMVFSWVLVVPREVNMFIYQERVQYYRWAVYTQCSAHIMAGLAYQDWRAEV